MRGTEEGARLLEKGATIRNAIAGFPLISAVKWTLAEMQGDDGWRRVHPPLSGLTDAEWRSLRAKLDEYRLFDRSGARALA
jgi:hypothetical protein